eukprot:GHVS01065141.1.p1 GENE.GHVS01065141.1~~GHVS01065141.1.p1  ORF type:complete len:119 (-),score=17.53 GHVS01065141.1:334-690(-)
MHHQISVLVVSGHYYSNTTNISSIIVVLAKQYAHTCCAVHHKTHTHNRQKNAPRYFVAYCFDLHHLLITNDNISCFRAVVVAVDVVVSMLLCLCCCVDVVVSMLLCLCCCCVYVVVYL